MNTTVEATLKRVLDEYARDPIDLLNISDEQGEIGYLRGATASYRRTLRDLARSAPTRSRIVEFGSFLGVVSVALARLGHDVTAVDIPEFMSNAKLRDRLTANDVRPVALNLRVPTMPFDDASFDVAVMCETLEHLNFNPLPVLKEVNRILRRGGIFYVGVPNQTRLENRIGLAMGRSVHNPIQDFFAQLDSKDNMIVGLHWREYTRQELTELLVRLGFVVERHAYFAASDEETAPPRSIRAWIRQSGYRLLPQLKPSQIALARKSDDVAVEFHLTDATR